jgi:tetratricopeptide (TPR) repeat protein
MRRAILLLLLVSAGGCAYYNGMYNANRLAKQAEKAEREGRTFDAASLWGQVGVKADTVLARHSSSQWADNARLLRGKAYQRLGDCNSAVTVLRELLASSTDSTLTEEGAFLLGRCYQALGNSQDASTAFMRVVNSTDPEVRREALYQYGRSLRQGGSYAEALEFLGGTDDPRARGERAAALAGVGRVNEAFALADSLVAAGDTAAPWDSILAITGRADATRAASLTDQLVGMPQASPTQKSRWVFSEGQRLVVQDEEQGTRRIAQAIQLDPEGPMVPYARTLLLRIRMARAASADSLRVIRQDLADLLESSGVTGIQVGGYVRAATMVLEVLDSVERAAPVPDLRLFLAAETSRDSLGMNRFAGVLFRRVIDEHASSPYAAKALLALGALDPSARDTSLQLLAGLYADNPYYLASLGFDTPGFVALEDSLFRFANVMRRASRPAGQPRPRTPTPAGDRQPLN